MDQNIPIPDRPVKKIKIFSPVKLLIIFLAVIFLPAVFIFGNSGGAVKNLSKFFSKKTSSVPVAPPPSEEIIPEEVAADFQSANIAPQDKPSNEEIPASTTDSGEVAAIPADPAEKEKLDAQDEDRELKEEDRQEADSTAAVAAESPVVVPVGTANIAPHANPVLPPPAAVLAGNFVEVAKIGVKVPLVKTAETNVEKLHDLLDTGVILYPGSVEFGQIGLTVILGHSAPANWPNIKFDHAFSKINGLVYGDAIEVNYQNKVYRYSVIDTQIINKGNDIIEKNPDGSTLALMTCWPPGKDFQRVVVQAKFVE